jgi:hypothetical protein
MKENPPPKQSKERRLANTIGDKKRVARYGRYVSFIGLAMAPVVLVSFLIKPHRLDWLPVAFQWCLVMLAFLSALYIYWRDRASLVEAALAEVDLLRPGALVGSHPAVRHHRIHCLHGNWGLRDCQRVPLPSRPGDDEPRTRAYGPVQRLLGLLYLGISKRDPSPRHPADARMGDALPFHRPYQSGAPSLLQTRSHRTDDRDGQIDLARRAAPRGSNRTSPEINS